MCFWKTVLYVYDVSSIEQCKGLKDPQKLKNRLREQMSLQQLQGHHRRDKIRSILRNSLCIFFGIAKNMKKK